MPANRDITPCVVFAFNRPDKLQHVLSALKTQGVDRLIVFVDGPRNDAEVGLVEKCKAIAKEVNWVDKELHFAEQNRGLPALSDNMSMVLNSYKSAIFVEDDCLPMPGFYSFMRRALDHYESEKRVFSIGGYQPIQEKYFKNYPYSLVSYARFLCWGWATWQDRWKSIAPYLPRYLELFGDWKNVPNIAGQDIPMMVKACAEGKEKSWDINVAVCMLWLKQVQLLPTRGLVRNIGMEAGSHGTRDSRLLDMHNGNVYEQVIENIVWLDDVEVSKGYAEELNRFVNGSNQLTRCRRLQQALEMKLWALAPAFMKNWWRASRERFSLRKLRR